MSEDENNLGNLEFTNFILLVPALITLYMLYTFKSGNSEKAKMLLLIFFVILSFLIIRIDKYGAPFKFFETKKNKVDYKKLIFIMCYISIAFLYHIDNTSDNIINIIQHMFIRILIGIGIVFTFLETNTENETLLTFEYLLYHWVVFAMVFAFYYLTKAKDYPYAKMYLTIMMIISVVFMIIKPFFDVMFKFKTWKHSNYKYFNKNVSKKNNKNVLNNLMNYIIINIVLLGVYVTLTYTLLSYDNTSNKINYTSNKINYLDEIYYLYKLFR